MGETRSLGSHLTLSSWQGCSGIPDQSNVAPRAQRRSRPPPCTEGPGSRSYRVRARPAQVFPDTGPTGLGDVLREPPFELPRDRPLQRSPVTSPALALQRPTVAHSKRRPLRGAGYSSTDSCDDMGLPTRQPPRQASSPESECHERGSDTTGGPVGP